MIKYITRSNDDDAAAYAAVATDDLGSGGREGAMEIKVCYRDTPTSKKKREEIDNMF